MCNLLLVNVVPRSHKKIFQDELFVLEITVQGLGGILKTAEKYLWYMAGSSVDVFLCNGGVQGLGAICLEGIETVNY